jgi:hypothetical protein
VPTATGDGAAQWCMEAAANVTASPTFGRNQMPVILWLLGVPLVVVVLLMLMHVI